MIGRRKMQAEVAVGLAERALKMLAFQEAAFATLHHLTGDKVEQIRVDSKENVGATKFADVAAESSSDDPARVSLGRPAADMLGFLGRAAAGSIAAGDTWERHVDRAVDVLGDSIKELASVNGFECIEILNEEVYEAVQHAFYSAFAEAAKKLLQHRDVRAAVEAVAAELEAKGMVSGEEFHRLVDGVMPPKKLTDTDGQKHGNESSE